MTPDEKERITKVPTENLQAYNLYLAGRQNLYQRKLENLQRARELFEQAIALDPKFAKAYSGLSDTLMILYSNFGALEPDVVLPKCEDAARQGARARPEMMPISTPRSASWPVHRWDVTSSAARSRRRPTQAFERAIAINPNHAQALAWYAGQEMFHGEYAHAIELFERSLRLDPLARVSQLNLGESYAGIGEHRKALDTWLESAHA